MKTVKIHCGVSVENLCGSQVHPLTDVHKALMWCETSQNVFTENEVGELYSNSPDFVSTVFYWCQANKVPIELFFKRGIKRR